MLDADALGVLIAELIADELDERMAPVLADNKALIDANVELAQRLDALETRELLLPGKSDPGEVDMEAVESLIALAVTEKFEALPVPQDGKSVDLAEVRQLVAEAVAEIPAPKDGADCDMEFVKAFLAEEVALAVCALPAPASGKDGRDADMEEVSRLIDDGVKSAVAALPVPKDGVPGKDGLGLASALIDRDGALVVTLTDGSTKSLGPVVGKDGENGKDGEAFTLDDFDIIPLDERTIKMAFTKGEVMHSFELAIPALIYRNVWREGETYQRGDMVTWAGSIWHCDKGDCTTKPDGGDFTLAVKRGRDGKDAPK